MGSIFLPVRSGRTSARRFDFPGLVLLVLFLVSILYALSNGQREGWDSNLIIGFLWGSALLFVAFVAWELYTPTPLVNLVVFGVARFAAAAVVALIFGAGIYGSTYLVPLFVQTIQGYTPTRSGELLMPAGLMLGIVFPLAGRLTDRLPAYLIIAVGLGIFGLSNLLFYRADVDSSFWQLSFLVLLGRIGLGFVTPALNAGALSVLPQEMLAQGTGTINFVRQLGGALGVSMLSALVEIRYAFHADALTAMQNEANSSTLWELGLYAGLDKVWGVTHSQLHAGALDHLGKVLIAQAQRMAYDDGFAVVGALFWLGVLPALWMRRKRS
jgi:MFS family permease